MKLSIITVNLNNKTGLEKTVKSVCSQTFEEFEFIIIDGGSTDGSLDIIKRYEDNISCWVSEQDKGVYNAMNKGIKMAKGEYLQFLNSGDSLINSDVLNKVFKENKTEDIIFLLTDTIQRVRSGEFDIKMANCLGILSGHLLKAFELAQIEGRVEIIEKTILERKTTIK